MSTRTKGKKETERVLNLIPSKDTDRDWRFGEAIGASVLTAPAALPPSVDLRSAWWRVNDQRNTGSCVGWACADGILRHHLVGAGRVKRNELLSARFVWMASKEFDEFTERPGSFIEGAGTSLKSALDVVRKYGCVLNDDLPFDINTLMYSGHEDVFWAKASTHKVANYFNLGKNISQWKSWLATRGPILAGLFVDANFYNAQQTGGQLDEFDIQSRSGGHAVCIVGYTADRLIIRNSWGIDWGDKGFAYASEAYIQGAFFPESYGISL